MTITLITHSDCLLHDTGPGHVESPKRLEVIFEALKDAGLDSYFYNVEAPLATRDHLLLAHDPAYIEKIFTLAPRDELIYLDYDTVMSSHTLTAALRAVGVAIQGVDIVMSGKSNTVFCIVRPPGHHAERARAMGFCFFNNIAIAAAYALSHYKLKRVAIVDFDAHHGNGTENIFEFNKNVFLCSSFQYPFYPYDVSDPINTEREHIIHLPLAAGSTSREFRAAFTFGAFEAIKEFKPEMIFISAGFDAHQQDMLSGLALETSDYRWITQQIKAIAAEYCQGRIVSCLEGGYALNVLGQCAVEHIKALMD